MQTKIRKYIKPTIKMKKQKTHLYFSKERDLNSIDMLLDIGVMASGGACCGDCCTVI
jgi:hypothetical protein